jgi:hypothetical protein
MSLTPIYEILEGAVKTGQIPASDAGKVHNVKLHVTSKKYCQYVVK